MKIKGSDIETSKRERLLISANERLVMLEEDTELGDTLRRFRLKDANGKNAGIVYSDQLNPGVLERFDDVPQVQETD